MFFPHAQIQQWRKKSCIESLSTVLGISTDDFQGTTVFVRYIATNYSVLYRCALALSGFLLLLFTYQQSRLTRVRY
ncbi:hypothetical protein NIES37_39910 [Tolypothrix tenuis PCC 7101]|uniref:Transposase n=1 Tax=Tolypothrix tenuis PCC 7101 TaxID=231146 RepID=A0A1Z4N2Q1_9CYAN|nr:hypothetical protein NIES37_39910 [Tolypothrix tenuis PCC 7101]BAZ76071.1 hypothetical protein NIES50_46680 [Aulosira laxa NIES-50]